MIDTILKELRADLRNLGKYAVLNKAYAINANTILQIKATKQCIMAMQISRNNQVILNFGSLWDMTQKRILDEVKNFLEGVQ